MNGQMATAGVDLSIPCGPIRPVSLHFTARARHFGRGGMPRPLGPGRAESIVGYQTGVTGKDNNFVVIPFLTAGHNTADIQSIKISDDGAGSIGWGGELFSIWEGVPTVVANSEYFYCDSSLDLTGEAKDYYWGDAAGNKVAFSVDNGQGVVVNCASDLKITTSGQVSGEKVTFTTTKDNNFTGNPFPMSIDIQSIKISDDGAGSIGWGGELFSIWEGVPTVLANSEYFYCDSSLDVSGNETDFYWGDAAGNKVAYPISAGKGVVINCAEGLTVTIESPIEL